MDEWSHMIQPVYDSDAVSIVFCIDDKYCKYFASALQSLIQNSSEYRKYDIIVFSSDISESNRSIIERMAPDNYMIRFFDVEPAIADLFPSSEFGSTKEWPLTVYYRCMIPLIMRGYTKVMYCDSDIIFRRDICDFFDLEFDDNLIIAVKDIVSPIMERYRPKMYSMLRAQGMDDPSMYFNSGVLNINVADTDTDTYRVRIAEVLNRSEFLYPDQDLLNLIYQGRTKLVSCKYNFQTDVGIRYLRRITDEQYLDDYRTSKDGPTALHYIGRNKPWLSRHIPYSDSFWCVAQKTPYYRDLIDSYPGVLNQIGFILRYGIRELIGKTLLR